MNRAPLNRATPGPHFFPSVAVIILVAATGAIVPGSAAQGATASVQERASHLAREGRTEEAVKLLQADIADHPADLADRLALADLYLKSDRRAEAEQQLREAL